MTREQTLYGQWLQAVEEPYRKELEEIREDGAEITDRFYRDLEFGTGGLRGVLGLGTNRMNVYTVRRATQGLANYLGESGTSPSAAVAYDSRLCSQLFAQETARVLAANGVKVYLYRELMPTPALSYAVREFGCDAGVVITASHNPAQYNGYKAYGGDGCQIGPEVADRVLAYMERVNYFDVPAADFDAALASGQIEYISDAFVEQYVDRVYQESIRPEVCRKAGLGLVYTPLNGAGRRCVCAVLDRLGLERVTIVPEQENPDGNFPTCPYPNPEFREALELGLALCEKEGADLLLATDPDCDRVAAAVRRGDEYRILTGNEVGVLLLDYICRSRKEKGTLPENPVAVTTIVSTRLAEKVAGGHGVEMVDVLTGFKFIGEVIADLEEKGEVDRYLFGFEESCGYLSGPYVRDKDAVNGAMLLVEMASHYKLLGKTLADVLEEIYGAYGYYANDLYNFAFEGADGMKEMEGIMDGLRGAPPTELAGRRVVEWVDYRASQRIREGTATAVSLPKSNVLEYKLEDGCGLIVRPSGTEPKIKLYCSLVGTGPAALQAIRSEFAQVCGKIVGK